MAILEAELAVRRHLQTLTPILPTALEAIPFTPPDSMYQRLQFVINEPSNPTFGPGYYRENIQVQLFVVDKLDSGTNAAITRAEALRNLFNQGLTLVEGGFRMFVLRTPRIAGVQVASDRLVVPVLISLTVEVFEP